MTAADPGRTAPMIARLVTCAALAGAVGLASACSGADQTKAPDVAKLKLVDRTAKASGPVDKVTWLLAEEPESLDLDGRGGTDADTVMSNVCERLFQVQPDLSVKPQLAEKVEEPDPKTMVLTIRDGVTFHDGSKLTADDVVWSLKRHAKPGADESDEFDQVDTIEKTGPREVTVRFSKPNALFKLSMAGDGGIIQSQRVRAPQGKDYGTPGFDDGCTGPYQVERWRSGTDLTITRYDGYWDKDVEPLTKQVVFRWADENALVNSLATGEADGTYLGSPAAATPLTKNDQLTVAHGPTTEAFSLIPTDNGAMKDPQVRRALSLAVDRAGIVKSGFGGFAQPWRLPVGEGAWGYEEEAFKASYDELAGMPASPTAEDLDEAKKLVKDAGSPAEPIVIASDGDQARSVIANAVRDAAQKIGLKAEIKTVPPSKFGALFTDEKAREGIDVVPENWYISKNDPIGFYDNAVSGNENNWVKYSDKEYDRLVAKALETSDDAARAKLVVSIQEKFADDMVWVPLVQVPTTLVLSKKLSGAPASMSFLYYPWAVDVGKA